jgi:Flp pilus assembly protein TadD
LWRKQWGAAALLAGAAYVGLQHIRMQALFACVVVVVGGDVLAGGWNRITDNVARPRNNSSRLIQFRVREAGVLIVAVVLTGLASFRSWDLIFNRYYMRSVLWSEFGSGLSWWFPERAVDFVQREKLPANVFNGYNLGGYLTWRLFPAYRDYIDGRALPFGPELFFRAYDLSTERPDSEAWQKEVQARGINTIIVPLSRYQGMSLFPQLPAFCRSKSWRPVYLDEVSAIFVRVTPENSALVSRLGIDCAAQTFAPPIDLRTARARVDLFNFYTNAGGVLYSLGRYSEAIADLDRAQSIGPENASVHLLRALVLEQTGKPAEAENEFRTSLNLDSSDEAWFDLGLFYMTQRRYEDAAEVLRKSALVSARPHDMWLTLGLAYLQMHQPEPALDALDKAEATSPFGEAGASLGSTFDSLIATGRSKAWYQLGEVERAVSFQEEAVKLAPNDSKLWLGLADLYDVEGRTTKAAEARSRAAAISH